MDFEGAFFDTNCFIQTDTKLGEGAFGTVFLVERKSDNKQFAGKIINSAGLLNGSDQLKFLRESQILNKLNHPAIVKFFGINFHSFKDPTKLEPTILTEYIKNGSLQGLLEDERNKKCDKQWNMTKKCICLLGIAHAMAYLHSNRVIHRDLKPANVLMDDDFYPRVCDFGVSRCFSEEVLNKIQSTMTFVGTPFYMAPELLDVDTESYGAAVDVYAFSLLAYEVVTGLMPWMHLKPFPKLSKFVQLVQKGERPKFNSKPTQKMIALIEKCWSHNQFDRPTFDQIYHILSTDFSSYFNEDELDKSEIEGYIEKLNESNPIEVSKTLESRRISSLLFDVSKLNVEKELSRGSLGRFYKVSDESGTKYTLKVIKSISGISGQTVFFESIELQSNLKHCAVMPLIGFSIPTEKSNQFSVITPFMSNGSFDKIIQKVSEGKPPTNWPTLRAIVIFGVAAGMAYIHQQDIVLADLRPEIVLFDDKNRPQIGGFVNAFFLKQGSECHNTQAMRGIPVYMAPEILISHTPFSNKIDVFSYGIILYAAFTLKTRPDVGMRFQTELLEKGSEVGKIPKKFVDLIRACWDPNPDCRPSFIQIVQKFMVEKESYFDMDEVDETEFDDYIEDALENLAFW